MNDYVIADTAGISIVLQSSGHVRGSTGRDIFGAARHVSSAQSASYLGGVGVWGHGPPGNLKKKHSETLFPAFLESKYQFPR